MLSGKNSLTSPTEVPLSFVEHFVLFGDVLARKTLKTQKFLREHHDDRCTRVLAVFILGTETSMQK